MARLTHFCGRATISLFVLLTIVPSEIKCKLSAEETLLASIKPATLLLKLKGINMVYYNTVIFYITTEN